MITAVVQRWRDRRVASRPAGELIDVRSYDVAPIADDRTAKAFVIAHHYSASYPAARFRFGLFRRGELVGVAVFSHPANERVLSIFPGPRLAAVELGRFVLLDDVPGNGETWFLGRAFELLRREGITGVLSFSDPFPRTTGAGERVFPGHVGTIYQAHNARYLGRNGRRSLYMLPDGSIFSARAASKVRAGERGWKYSVELLRAHGAPALADDRGAWLRDALASVARVVRHPGNHRYVWSLDRRGWRHLPAGQSYPKFDAQLAPLRAAQGQLFGRTA